MIVIRKRLIFWLIKAYFKKSKKILFFSFLLGLIIFFAFLFGSKYIKAILSFSRQPVIGIIGSYERDDLPNHVVNNISRGLTKVDIRGSIEPDLAKDFSVSDDGKIYKFTIKDNLEFNDKTEFTAKDIEYNFSDVEVEIPDENSIIFRLKDPYSPFLATVSRPVLKDGIVGIGAYNISDIELNGSFVQSITLSNRDNRFERIKYIFYPTEEALKTAFAMGEVNQARGIIDTTFLNTSFDDYPGSKVTRDTNYSNLVTLFFNTSDSVLSDRKVRLGLNYALPDDFENGENTHLPYSPQSIYYNDDLEPARQDIERASLLMPDSKPTLNIKVFSRYRATAEKIAVEWEKLGIKVEIEEVSQVPDRFQLFLGEFNVPIDPDQYTLWHSGQSSNISRLNNLRIDKLLEDGRKTTDPEERKKIYNDFQKFLLEEMPASFLYFPKEFTVSRN